jgi:hypothetical protein
MEKKCDPSVIWESLQSKQSSTVEVVWHFEESTLHTRKEIGF